MGKASVGLMYLKEPPVMKY